MAAAWCGSYLLYLLSLFGAAHVGVDLLGDVHVGVCMCLCLTARVLPAFTCLILFACLPVCSCPPVAICMLLLDVSKTVALYPVYAACLHVHACWLLQC